MHAVLQVFEDILPRLNLAPNPPVENFGPVEGKRYLMENRLKFCVLAVDSETIRDAYDKLPQRKREYEDLLEKAAEKVGKKEFFSRGIVLDGKGLITSISKLFVCAAQGLVLFSFFSVM